MLIAYLIFALCAVFFLIALGFYLAPASPRPTSVPGPNPSDKNDGNLGDIARAGSLHEYLETLHDKFGPIVSFWWGQQNIISVCTATFFKDHSKFFDRPIALFQFLEPLVGMGSLQFTNGSEGKSRRDKYDQHFTTEACENYVEDLLKVAGEMAGRWKEKFTSPGDHLPIHSFMTAYAIRSISTCCFGDIDHRDLVELSDEYVVSMEGMLRRWHGPVYSEDDPREKRFMASIEKIKSILGKVIQSVLDDRKKEQSGGDLGDRPYLLIDTIVDSARAYDDPSMPKKEEIIIADAISFFIGGFHTTSNLLTWCLYYLAKYRDVQDKLRAELVSVLGPDADKNPLTLSNYSNLVYCRAVVDETLRCAKIAPIAARCSENEHHLGPHVIPPCTPVIHALGVSLDDQDYYQEPEKFDPERFTPESRDKRPALAFSPFGFGRRKCPGFRFAYMESFVLLSVVLRKFSLRLVDDELEAIPHFGFVTKPRDEIHAFLDVI